MAKRTKRNGMTWDGPGEIIERKKKPAPKPKPKAPNPKKRRNSSESAHHAQELAEAFHGRSDGKVTEYTEEIHTPTNLAHLGKLLTLEILTPYDEEFTLKFSGVELACTPNGRQLYFVGGNQAVDLEAIGIEAEGKDHADIGEVLLISYYTRKGFHNFEPIEYGHTFGEDGGFQPSLHYDLRNKLLYLTGGSYYVTAAGIED